MQPTDEKSPQRPDGIIAVRASDIPVRAWTPKKKKVYPGIPLEFLVSQKPLLTEQQAWTDIVRKAKQTNPSFYARYLRRTHAMAAEWGTLWVDYPDDEPIPDYDAVWQVIDQLGLDVKAMRFSPYKDERVNGHHTINLDFSKGHDHKANHTSEGGIIEERTDEIEPQRKEWLWPPYIPSGRITIVAGDPGIGKSQIGIDLVSRISRGASMPESDIKHGLLGACAIATAEDHTAETIVPRIIAAGGNRSKIRVIRKVEIDGEERYLSFPRDLAAIKTYIVNSGLRMLIIDPLNAFLGADTDTYRDHDVRLVLGPLEDIAETTGCAILVIAHLNKKEDVATLYRVGGSIGFIGAARSVLAVAKDKNDEDRRILYSLKCNLSRRPPALQYTVDYVSKVDDTHIVWHGLSDFDPERSGKDDGPQKLRECTDFLRQELSDGGVLAETIVRDARSVGIAKRTLDKYKLPLGVRSFKRGDKWYWAPPKEGWKK